MARLPRVDIGNNLYHVINRANARLQVFFKEEDYKLFEDLLQEAVKKYNMRLLAYCLMPNHFHLVLHSKNDGDVQKFMQWLTLTHTQRWHIQNKSTGTGHLYQGRYKSFLIEEDNHLLAVIRYVERNPLKANLVQKIENWDFSSLSKWLKNKQDKFISEWPIKRPENYLAFVQKPLTQTEEETIRYSIVHGKPYGGESWTDMQIDRFNLKATVRRPGRPKKGT